MQLLAAQIEEAIFEARLLRIIRLAEHRQRQLFSRAQDFGRRHAHFDLARRKIGVHRFLGAFDDLAIDTHDALGAQALEQRERFRAGVRDQLGNAVIVAQVDEEHAAQIALAMDPAGEAHVLACVRRPKGAARMAAIGVHEELQGGLVVLKICAGQAHVRPVQSSAGGAKLERAAPASRRWLRPSRRRPRKRRFARR